MEIAPTSSTPLCTSPKSPEPEAETPTRIKSDRPISFTNGVLKRHLPLYPHAPPVVVTYRECLKNHAAALGGHALDGCGEFMPSPTATPTNPSSLKCAACGCHRNVHRREPEDHLPQHPATTVTATLEYQPHHRHHPPPPPASNPHRSPNSASPPPISSSYYPSAPHMLLALSGGLTVTAGALDNNSPNLPLKASNLGNSSSKKRFRTKFTQFQKDKMLEFAERVGWKMQKRDEEVQKFCNEIGVDRGVLKVWMHNNKNAFGKKLDQPNDDGAGIQNGNNGNHEDSSTNIINGQNPNHNFETDNVGHVGINGSSSSS